MEKKISGELIVIMLFIGSIVFLLVFGSKITGYAVSEGQEQYKLDIEIENTYTPGEQVNFKIILYDLNNKEINEKVNYIIKNYYSDIIEQGEADSGIELSFLLAEDAIQGPWGITASYNDVGISRLFKVEKLEKADIELVGNSLVVRNIGNSAYDKDILIYIGDNDQTAKVHLEIGQTKTIRLTAPDGEYKVRVISEDASFEVEGVSLTGNVVGLERVLEDDFWKRYPLVSLFLAALGLMIIVITMLKLRDKFSKK